MASKRSREARRTEGEASFPDAQPEKGQPGEGPALGLASPLEFLAAHPRALTLHCSDGRFTQAVEWLMREQQLLRYDIVAMPGGPALLDMTGANILEAEATRTSVTFLVRGHGIEHAVLIAHTGCSFYQKRLAGQPPEIILERQVHDLHVAAAWFRRVHPKIEVRAFMAVVSGTSDEARRSQIAFHPVELDAQISSLLL